MDTVWTTVKVRRSVLSEAAEMLPGMSNAAIVQRALESVLGNSPSEHPSTGAPAPSRAPAEEAGGGSGARTASHRPAPLARIEGQATVEEMLASCPNCATTLENAELVDQTPVLVCPDCGYARPVES